MADLARPVNRAGGAGQGTQAVIRKHSHDLPIGLSHGPRDGSVVSLPRLRATRSLATGRDKSRPAEFDSGGSGRSLTAARERPMAFKRQAGGSQTGRRHNAYALDRLCAVFWLGPMDHWNCDRGCKPAQLVEQLGGNWFAYPSTEPRFGFWAGWPPHSTQLRRIIGVSWRPP